MFNNISGRRGHALSSFKPLLICFILLTLLSLVLFALDKAKSKRKGSSRIPERTLLWVARLGGGVGCWLGMMLFRHKTKHARFRVLVLLWTVVWAVGMVLLVRYW